MPIAVLNEYNEIASIKQFAIPMVTIPSNYLLCDGESHPVIDYLRLYKKLCNGTNHCIYGPITPGASFNVPDYRGYFLRGEDINNIIDQDDRIPRIDEIDIGPYHDVGTTQLDAEIDHKHDYNEARVNSIYYDYSGDYWCPVIYPPETFSSPILTGNSRGTVSKYENRPVNIYIVYAIRAY